MDKILGPKDALIFVPIAGTAIAVAFDVGYFWGVDINWFTFFSLSEHILFALEALPVGLVVGACVVLVCGVLPKIGGAGMQTNKAQRVTGARIRALLRRNIGEILIGLSGVVSFILGNYGDAIVSLALVVIMVCVRFVPLERRIYVLIPISVVLVLFIPFAAGRSIARNYISGTTVLHTLVTPEGNVEGRVVRSGDKGVLFVDTKMRTVELRKWDNIRSITTPVSR